MRAVQKPRADMHVAVRLAATAEDILAAQRLRYEVFVGELGGDGPLVDHEARLERDEFDPVCDHLLATDGAGEVVAVYRLMRDDQATLFGRFYSETEYDLSALKRSGRRLLELGRSCVRRDHRGGPAMLLIWNALADYVLERDIEILFGMASFHGTDIPALSLALSYLHHHHLAPEELRVRAQPGQFQPMDLLPAEAVDRRAALAVLPPLIKAYLRFGGTVGEGAFVDHAFNTTDVCLILDTADMSERHRGFYIRNQGPDGPDEA